MSLLTGKSLCRSLHAPVLFVPCPTATPAGSRKASRELEKKKAKWCAVDAGGSLSTALSRPSLAMIIITTLKYERPWKASRSRAGPGVERQRPPFGGRPLWRWYGHGAVCLGARMALTGRFVRPLLLVLYYVPGEGCTADAELFEDTDITRKPPVGLS